MSIPKVDINVGAQLFLTKKNMAKEMFKLAPKSLKTFMNIDKYSGEAFNIGINALGTAAVAPIFIAYNPLSKADENTKKYSAMRQPISAVLAVLTQAGLVIPWDRMVDGLTNQGKLGQYYSQEAFQDSKYLYRYYKKQNPNLSKAQINELVKTHQSQQYGKLYASLLNDGKIIVGNTELPQEDVLSLINETCDSIIKKNRETLQRYNKEKIDAQLARANYLTEHYDIAKRRLNNLLNAIQGKSDKESINIIKQEIKNAKRDGIADEWIKILRNDLLPKGDNASISEQIRHILKKAVTYKNNESNLSNFIIEQVQERIYDVKKQIEHFEQIKNLIAEKKPIQNIIEKLRITNLTENARKSIDLDNIGIMVVDKYIDKISKRIKGTKAISGLLVSLAIMPLTCHALNYLYPRFMDKFFPELANAKRKGGNK